MRKFTQEGFNHTIRSTPKESGRDDRNSGARFRNWHCAIGLGRLFQNFAKQIVVRHQLRRNRSRLALSQKLGASWRWEKKISATSELGHGSCFSIRVLAWMSERKAPMMVSLESSPIAMRLRDRLMSVSNAPTPRVTLLRPNQPIRYGDDTTASVPLLIVATSVITAPFLRDVFSGGLMWGAECRTDRY